MAGSNGAVQADDFDAILAEQFKPITFGGVTYEIIPITSATQKFARELRAQIEKKEIDDLTVDEFAALVAVRCMRPQPERPDEIPTVIYNEVLSRARRGIDAVERLGGPEKNGEAPPPAPSP